MMAFLRRALRAEPHPITHLNTIPAARDEEKERELKLLHGEMARSRMNSEMRSRDIRQELAGNVLRIVAGET